MLFFFILQGPDRIDRETAERFARLYDDLFPKVFRYVNYRIVDRHVAEDLTSRTFEKALTKFHRFSADKASFSTWVFSIARNTLIDHFRQAGHNPKDVDDPVLEVSGDASSPEATAMRNEERRELLTYVSRLSGQEQELLSLKFGSGLSNREIAAIKGLGESNVGVILYRSVRKLRDLLAAHA